MTSSQSGRVDLQFSLSTILYAPPAHHGYGADLVGYARLKPESVIGRSVPYVYPQSRSSIANSLRGRRDAVVRRLRRGMQFDIDVWQCSVLLRAASLLRTRANSEDGSFSSTAVTAWPSSRLGEIAGPAYARASSLRPAAIGREGEHGIQTRSGPSCVQECGPAKAVQPSERGLAVVLRMTRTSRS
jgi:hypothetical protein